MPILNKTRASVAAFSMASSTAVPPAAYMSATATGLVNPRGFRFSDNTLERRMKNKYLNGLKDPDPPRYNSNVIFDKVLRESSKDPQRMLDVPFIRRKAH